MAGRGGKKKKAKKSRAKSLRAGIRLRTPAPRLIKSGREYDRRKRKSAVEEGIEG